MRLHKISMILLLPLLLFSKPVKADYYDPNYSSCYNCCDDTWYGIVGAGYAFSLKTHLDVDTSDWDFANQGYDDNLGGSPFFFIGFGRTICCWLDFDVTYSYYQTFHYQKYQTGGNNPGTPRTRFFDLDHQNVMFDLTFDPTWRCLRWQFYCLDIRPIVGVGIGAGINRVGNFHTVRLVVDETDAIAVGSTTSIGDPITQSSFAWRVLAALRFGFGGCCPLTMDIGYRYYDGGRFRCPSATVENTFDLQGEIFDGTFWKGRLRANEIYLALNWGF